MATSARHPSMPSAMREIAPRSPSTPSAASRPAGLARAALRSAEQPCACEVVTRWWLRGGYAAWVRGVVTRLACTSGARAWWRMLFNTAPIVPRVTEAPSAFIRSASAAQPASCPG